MTPRLRLSLQKQGVLAALAGRSLNAGSQMPQSASSDELANDAGERAPTGLRARFSAAMTRICSWTSSASLRGGPLASAVSRPPSLAGRRPGPAPPSLSQRWSARWRCLARSVESFLALVMTASLRIEKEFQAYAMRGDDRHTAQLGEGVSRCACRRVALTISQLATPCTSTNSGLGVVVGGH